MSSAFIDSPPWELAFDRPHERVRFTEVLRHCLRETGDGIRYAMLPNFRFNHTGLRVTDAADLILGELHVEENQGDSMSIHREDTTSGEWWAARIEGTLTLAEIAFASGILDSKRVLPPSATITVCPGLTHTDVILTVGALTRSIGRAPSGQTIVFGPSLFAGLHALPSNGFSIVGSSWTLHTDLRSRRIDSAVLNVSGRTRELDCIAIWGPRTAPSHWWIDDEGNIVMMTSALWTYVRWRGTIA